MGGEDAVETAISGGAHLLYRIVESIGGFEIGGKVAVDLNSKLHSAASQSWSGGMALSDAEATDLDRVRRCRLA